MLFPIMRASPRFFATASYSAHHGYDLSAGFIRRCLTLVLFVMLLISRTVFADWATSNAVPMGVLNQVLTPPPYWQTSSFGAMLACEGDYLAVLGYYAGPEGTNDAVLVYAWDTNTQQWVNDMRLDAIYAIDGASSSFGREMAFSEEGRLVISDERANVNGSTFGNWLYDRNGAVHIYERTGTAEDPWVCVANLRSPDVQPGEAYGRAIALEGDTLLVSDPNNFDANLWDETREVYAYVRDGLGTWTYQQTLTQTNEAFGEALALSGHTLAIRYGGGVYIYKRAGVGEAWTFSQDIQISNTICYATHEIRLQDNQLLISDGEGCLWETGRVHVLQRAHPSAPFEADALLANPASLSLGLPTFGAGMACQGDVLIVSDANHFQGSAKPYGALCAFTYDTLRSPAWSLEGYTAITTHPDAEVNNKLQGPVAFSGHRVAASFEHYYEPASSNYTDAVGCYTLSTGHYLTVESPPESTEGWYHEGDFSPWRGVHLYPHGLSMTCTCYSYNDASYTDYQRYDCVGWDMVGNEPAYGTNTACSLMLTNSATLTWRWTNTVYFNIITLSGGDASHDSGYYPEGDLTVTAYPDEGYEFLYWKNSGVEYPTNPIIWPVTLNGTIVANFRKLPVLTVNAGAGGTTWPTGSQAMAFSSSTSVVIQASAGSHIQSIALNGSSVGFFGPSDTCCTQHILNAQTDQTLDVVFNRYPEARAVASPTSGVTPLRVTLDLRASSDPDGDPLRADVDAFGDGTFEIEDVGTNFVVVEFGQPGVFQAGIRCSDPCGAASVTTLTVTARGPAPVADLTATPETGAAPLVVQFCATNSSPSPGHALSVFEWDVDSDGAVDRLSTNGLLMWTYRTPGARVARVRVTDDHGLRHAATAAVDIAPGVNPPSIELSATPDEGALPLSVSLEATVTDDGTAVRFAWDLDGDGQSDLLTPSNTLTTVYTTPGQLAPGVTVRDNDGLESSATASLTIEPPVAAHVWMDAPETGWRVWGNAITLSARTPLGQGHTALLFEASRNGSNTWSAVTNVLEPADGQTILAAWDVTGISSGHVYDVRAVVDAGAAGTATSALVTVTIDPAAGQQEGGVIENDGTRSQTLDMTVDQSVGLNDGTIVTVPAGAIETNSTLVVQLIGQDTNGPSGSAAGAVNIDANRVVSLEDDPALNQPLTLLMPYADADQDGFVDGTQIPEATLSAHWFDVETGSWKRALTSIVHVNGNYVEATTWHLTEFGLFGQVNLLHPANGVVLEAPPSQAGPDTPADHVVDDNPFSYWQSASPPSDDEVFLYRFTNDLTAVISAITLQNPGPVAAPTQSLSQTVYVDVSVNGVAFDRALHTNLPPDDTLQTYAMDDVLARVVRLTIAEGYATNEARQLAGFGLTGVLSADGDNDGIGDTWELAAFTNLAFTSGTNDLDADGLDNRGEEAHGTQPFLADTDGDGMSDGEEVVAGTSATNASELFSITELTTTQANLRITWSSVTGRVYELYHAAHLTGVWSSIRALTNDRPISTSTNLTPLLPVGYYRLGVRAP